MISELLDKEFKSKKREQRVHETLYPTQASAFINHGKYKKLEGKCMRQAYYNCMGVVEEEEINLRQNLIFKIGDYVEDMVLDTLKAGGVLEDSQVKFFNEKYNISGRYDGLINYLGRKVGLEIKSIGGNNKWTTNQIWGSQWNKPEPKWLNLFQTIVYVYANKEVVDEFVLFYIRRDTCETKEFVISIEPRNGKLYACIDGKIDERYLVNDILDRYAILLAYVKAKTIPPRELLKTYNRNDIPTYVKLGIISKRQGDKYDEEPFGDFECRYCGYVKLCDKNDSCSEINNDL